jgi:hypothetical protein
MLARVIFWRITLTSGFHGKLLPAQTPMFIYLPAPLDMQGLLSRNRRRDHCFTRIPGTVPPTVLTTTKVSGATNGMEF